METFIEALPLVDNPRYAKQKTRSRAALLKASIDQPIIGIIQQLNDLPHCFTLQCCWGHFVYPGQKDPHNLQSLSPDLEITSVLYRIAYIAFCIENSAAGRELYNQLRALTAIDPANIQFGGARWFWKRQINTYVIQVEPERLKYKDQVTLDFEEALNIQHVRNEFYNHLHHLLL